MFERATKYFPLPELLKILQSVNEELLMKFPPSFTPEKAGQMAADMGSFVIEDKPQIGDSEEQFKVYKQYFTIINKEKLSDATGKDKALAVIYKTALLINLLPDAVSELMMNSIRYQSDYLDLSGKNIDDQQTLVIVAILPCTNLVSLNLRNNNINGTGAIALATCDFLRTLNLAKNQITNDAVAIACGSRKTLIELNLDDSNFSIVGHAALAGSPFLKKLSLNNSQVNAAAAKKYALSTFVEFSLNKNNLDAESLKSLADNLFFQSLSLADNNITDEMAKKFALNTNLRSLDFRNNQIGDEGAKSFLLNTTLTSLNLSNNKISVIMVAAFAACTNSISVDLSHNPDITSDAVKAMCELCPTTSYNQAVKAKAPAIFPTLIRLSVFAAQKMLDKHPSMTKIQIINDIQAKIDKYKI